MTMIIFPSIYRTSNAITPHDPKRTTTRRRESRNPTPQNGRNGDHCEQRKGNERDGQQWDDIEFHVESTLIWDLTFGIPFYNRRRDWLPFPLHISFRENAFGPRLLIASGELQVYLSLHHMRPYIGWEDRPPAFYMFRIAGGSAPAATRQNIRKSDVALTKSYEKVYEQVMKSYEK